MPYNAALLQKLAEPEFLDKPGAQDALDAILAKDPANMSNIRAGFAAHQDFWAQVLSLGDKTEVKDDLLFLNDDNKAEIVQRLAHNRAKLGLRTATPAVLQNIITADPDGVRKKFFKDAATKAIGGDQLATRLASNVTNETIITNAAVDDLHLEAQYQLLSKRIKEVQQDQQLDPATAGQYFNNIFTALNSGNDANFQTALNSLNKPKGPLPNYPEFPSNVVEKMAVDEVGKRIKNEIALENFRKNIGTIYDSLKGDDPEGIHATLNKADPGEFTQGLPLSYRGLTLTAEEAKPFKAILGERYLVDQVIAKQNPEQLRLTSKTTDVNGLIATLGDARTDPYLTTAVHQGNIARLREAAALQLLIKRIQETTDTDALKELTDTRSSDNLKNILEKHATLSLDENANDNATIREAFTNRSIRAVVAAAHVRLSLINSNDIAKLTAIIPGADDPEQFARKFIASFPMQDSKLRGVEVSLLKDYFAANPDNALQARRQALLNAAKAKFESPDVTAEELNTAVTGMNVNNVLRLTRTKLGLEERDIDTLLVDRERDQFGTNPDLLSRKLAAYAFVARGIKHYERSNLNDGAIYNQITDQINALNQPLAPELEPLSEPEKHDFATRLTAIIVKQNPAIKANELLTLSTANSLQEFKDALDELNIHNHTWVNEKTMESMQKAAVQGAISQQIQSITNVDDKAYPALTNFINTLSLEHHKQLLQPNFLNQLLDSRNAEDIKARLHCKLADANKILEDFEQVDRIKSIQNPAIAAQLLKMPRIPNLTKEQVEKINERLEEKAPASGVGADFKVKLTFEEDDYEEHLNQLFAEVGLEPAVERAIKRALDDDEDDLQTKVMANRELNHYLANYNNTHAGESKLEQTNRDVINFLQALPKGPKQQFKDTDITTILGHFQQAKSRDDLIAQIKTVQPRFSDTLTSFERELTPRRFEEFKRNFKKAKMLESIKGTDALDFTNLDKSIKEVKELYGKISKATSRIDLELKALSWLKSMQWLNPAFQASAAQYAHAMLPQMQEVAKGCDILVMQLQHQYDTITKELNDLPDINEAVRLDELDTVEKLNHRKKANQIDKKAEELKNLQADIAQTLKRYKKVQRMLNGDPDGNGKPNENNEFLQKGALKVLEEAKDVKHSVKFLGYESAYKDYPMSKLKEHLDPNWKGSINADERSQGITEVAANGSEPRYELVSKMADGDFREHTIGTGKAKGVFIEKRNNQDMATKREKDGSYSVNPSVSLLLTQFPAKEMRGNQETAESQKARITYGFAVASQILSTLSGPPTADKPIVLKGINPRSAEELPYIWTALMLIGKENPHMRFGKDAIKVNSGYFDPHDELNFVGRFSGQSHFKKVFAPNATLYKDLLNQMIDYQDDKSHKYEEKKKVLGGIVKDIKDEFKDKSTGNAITRLFKTKLEEAIETSKQKNTDLKLEEQQLKLK